MSGYEHVCQSSEDREAEARNLAWFSHLSGENRARMGWPDSVRIFALRLSGEYLRADLLAMEGAKRSHHRAQTIEIPQQRKPHPLELHRASRAKRAEPPPPSAPVYRSDSRIESIRSDINNNRNPRL